MQLNDIRSAFLAYAKTHGHTLIPSASLVPENDPTTLFTGSGMQPLIPYLLGEDHPSGTRLANSQKCFRSGDIEEVGDNRHTTFFEMLGNWSLGDYGKKEQLHWFFTFLVEELGLDPRRLYVTVFAGDESCGIGADKESAQIWQTLFDERGIEAETAMMVTEEEASIRGIHPHERIFFYREKNWWSRAGAPGNMPQGEPGGPDSEVFYEFTSIQHDSAFGEQCHPNCDCGRFLEIGNSVFMQYVRSQDGSFAPLPKENVDFGGGLERILMAVTDTPDIIEVCHAPIVTHIEQATGKRYDENPHTTRSFRIIADHMKAAVFLIADGVIPSNTDQGYFVRRLLRRAVRMADALGMHKSTFSEVATAVIAMYADAYPALVEQKSCIEKAVSDEEEKFRTTLEKGLREFAKMQGTHISGKDAFILFSTYGFPLELTEELASEKGMSVDKESFLTEMEEHQRLSRAGSEQKFKGGLADASEITTMLHTCTHLMLAGLRKYLGTHVHQAGSNITAERTRFDFTHPEKVSREVLDTVEAYVNEAIGKGCTVHTVTMQKTEAQEAGVEGSFWEKYPDMVTVYEIVAPDGTVYSRELCGGPHVETTLHMKGVFKILKEESSAAGIRRVKAALLVASQG